MYVKFYSISVFKTELQIVKEKYGSDVDEDEGDEEDSEDDETEDEDGEERLLGLTTSEGVYPR